MTDEALGVGISGVGWCASQHIAAFQRNPHTRVTWLHGRDEAAPARRSQNTGSPCLTRRFTTSYEDLLGD